MHGNIENEKNNILELINTIKDKAINDEPLVLSYFNYGDNVHIICKHHSVSSIHTMIMYLINFILDHLVDDQRRYDYINDLQEIIGKIKTAIEKS